MSAKLGGFILEDCNRGLTAASKLILATLAGAADRDGVCEAPPLAQLARVACCEPKEVRSALRRFTDAKVLARVAAGDRGVGGRGGWWLDLGRALELYASPPSATTATAPPPGGEDPGAAGGGDSDDAVAARMSASTHWRASRPAIEAAIGAGEFAAWIAVLIPEFDNGTRLVLAAPTPLIRDEASRHLGSIEAVTGRQVDIAVRAWAGPASSRLERERREGATEAKAGERDASAAR